MNISNENVIISFGKPEYQDEVDISPGSRSDIDNTGTGAERTAYVVGLVQNMNLSQQRQVTRLFEIGNKEYDMVTSKVQSRLQLNKVLLDGPTLMKYIAYAHALDGRPYWSWLDDAGTNDERGRFEGGVRGTPDHYDEDHRENIHHQTSSRFGTEYYNEHYSALIEYIAQIMGDLDDDEIKSPSDILADVDNSGWRETPEHEIPGTSDFWINLTSKLFDMPIGIYLDIEQQGSRGEKYGYGGVFLENCIVSTVNISTQAQNRILTENVSIEVGRVIPCIEYGGYNISRIEHNKSPKRLQGDDEE